MKDEMKVISRIYSGRLFSNWVTPHTIFASRRKINLKVEALFNELLNTFHLGKQMTYDFIIIAQKRIS